ncbi:hypothetical protein CMI37_13475 [Candidatus Pacearchaeota archaeon]|nr:hypothetical protein [Candidatus Pacearchaeota archaeon]|tara:strand:- start:386 stop:670 length:285 start_codon:yes stop_codon:yes gene_type:complete
MKKRKEETNSGAKFIKLIAHNDRPVFVNADRIVYAMRATVEETSQDITRIVFDTGQEMDVQDRVDVVYKLASTPSLPHQQPPAPPNLDISADPA